LHYCICALLPHPMNDTHHLQYKSAAARYPIDRKNGVGEGVSNWVSSSLISANLSQSTALPMQVSYLACSDPIPTRSVSDPTCQRYEQKTLPTEHAREYRTLPLVSLRINLYSNVVLGGKYTVAPHTG
jgi:hypothetical protein